MNKRYKKIMSIIVTFCALLLPVQICQAGYYDNGYVSFDYIEGYNLTSEDGTDVWVSSDYKTGYGIEIQDNTKHVDTNTISESDMKETGELYKKQFAAMVEAMDLDFDADVEFTKTKIGRVNAIKYKMICSTYIENILTKMEFECYVVTTKTHIVSFLVYQEGDIGFVDSDEVKGMIDSIYFYDELYSQGFLDDMIFKLTENNNMLLYIIGGALASGVLAAIVLVVIAKIKEYKENQF